MTTKTVHQLSNGAYVDFKIKEDSNGTPVISELRIFFAEDSLAVGGIGSTILREIRTFDLMRMWSIKSSRSFLSADQELQLWKKIKQPWENMGRLGTPTELYAALAYFYLKYNEHNPKSPSANLATDLQIPNKTLNTRIARCRKLGLLGDPLKLTPSAKASGKLSTKSKSLITELLK
jgi:hypothetical protein